MRGEVQACMCSNAARSGELCEQGLSMPQEGARRTGGSFLHANMIKNGAMYCIIVEWSDMDGVANVCVEMIDA